VRKSKNSAALPALFQIILLVAIFMLYILQYPVLHAQTSKHLLILCFFAGSIALNFFIITRMIKVCEKEARLYVQEDMARSYTTKEMGHSCPGLQIVKTLAEKLWVQCGCLRTKRTERGLC